MTSRSSLIALAILALACTEAPDPTATRPNVSLVGGGQYLCTDSTLIAEPPPPPPPPPPGGNGQAAFIAACSSCHASRDGFDLAYFSYADSTIVRRALGHVDSATAQLISAYILNLSTPHVPEMELVFQPGGTIVPGGTNATGDVNFAIAAFGADAWPASYTRADVLALNPLIVPIALPLLPWSDETNTREWMPKDSIPTSIREMMQPSIDSYFASPSISALEAVVQAMNSATKTGVCNEFSSTGRNYPVCFEVRRWVATLSATHKLRNGGAFLSPALYLQWWHVGDVARRSRGLPGQQITDYLQHQARWMYLGWMFDVPNEPAVYGTQGFRSLGMPRHAVWLALRSIVARGPGVFTEDENPYMDFRELGLSTPSGLAWAYPAARFALEELVRRMNLGDKPPTAALRNTSTVFLDAGINALQAKMPATEYVELSAMADQLRAWLAVP